ncbi:MAG: PEP/pyruvate-binding domain-containing protein [Steroidobacteraceae bacterium]
MSELCIPLSSAAATDSGRFGAKAANLAGLGRIGLRVPGGFAIDAQAYRIQLAALGLERPARRTFKAADGEARRYALEVRLRLMDGPIAETVAEPLRAVWHEIMQTPGTATVVRSSALIEDRAGSSFAGQFDSFLGLDNEADFLTAVRSCWAALWSPRALRYMAGCGLDPADTAMGLLIQPLVGARVSGGGLSHSAEGEMTISATWGLGSAIAQGEVVPDRIVLGRDLTVREIESGRKFHRVGCAHGKQVVEAALVREPCLTAGEAIELGGMLLQSETVVGGPAEIEWARDDVGFILLQARPLAVAGQQREPEPISATRVRLRGHPAGIGFASGRACVVSCECELGRVGAGDILVSKVAGPALGSMLSRVAGVVAELGGSTSHLAALARERGVPMVLGVHDATERIPDGAIVTLDGVAGIVHWAR